MQKNAPLESSSAAKLASATIAFFTI